MRRWRNAGPAAPRPVTVTTGRGASNLPSLGTPAPSPARADAAIIQRPSALNRAA